jgi:hypothetical protein
LLRGTARSFFPGQKGGADERTRAKSRRRKNGQTGLKSSDFQAIRAVPGRNGGNKTSKYRFSPIYLRYKKQEEAGSIAMLRIVNAERIYFTKRHAVGKTGIEKSRIL